MRVTNTAFNGVAIAIGILALLLLPFWHFGQWGYMPSITMFALLATMFMLRALGTD